MADRSAEPEERATLVIIVVRTGGFAGLRREWRVEPPPPEEPDWESLVDACPWDDDFADDPTSRDRFVWSISVRPPAASRRSTQRRAVLAERDLTGPWRRLVDRVQEAGAEDGEPE